MTNSGTLIKKLGARSYLVQLPSGRKLRRNRSQLQARPDDVEGNDDDIGRTGKVNLAKPDVEGNQRQDDGSDEEDEDQQDTGVPEVQVTRSGRRIHKAAWLGDYTQL